MTGHDLQTTMYPVIELDPKHADVICRRYQEHTGTLPTRDGEPHDFITDSDG